ncbi:MAG: hypothetical protein PHQ58_20960 [Rhodoferax sp.]|uniref:hypothetical protein n=1 Tax=Rhodoferax sp. TaxID=50421 RepID=UPI002604D026|nr:hypothetical protein [Rhodoferax sp.]MDD2882890.1 hypothetical protein [Rhodoferax sp.]
MLALITHLSVVFGLLVLLPIWLAPLLTGGIAALASSADWKHAAGGTFVGLGAGVLLARPWFGGGGGALASPVESIIFIVLGAIAAGVVALALRKASKRNKAEWRVAIGAVAVVIALMWATTAASNRGDFVPNEPTVNQWLSTKPALGATPGDRDYFLRVFYDMHDGVPYYEAYINVYRADPLGEFRLPNGVPGYRLPTLFYLWLLLPADGSAIPWLFLVFATLAVGSAFAIGAQLGPPRLAVLGALMVATAYLSIATSSFVVFVDGWAMALTLAGIALFIASVRSASAKLLWAAMCVMLLAAVFREILIYPMLLAAASVVTLPMGQRLKALWPWLAGFGIFGAIYAAHASAIDGRVDQAGSVGFWIHGGLAHLAATLRFFDQLFAGAPWFVPMLVLAGLAGAVTLLLGQRRLGAFLVAVIAVPHMAFLFFGGTGRDLITGSVGGYWAMLVVPIALALAPVAIGRMLGLEDSAINDKAAS